MNSNKITPRQLILTIAAFGISRSISYMFVLDLPPRNQDIWLVILLGFVYSLILRIPLLFLSYKYPELTLVEVFEKIFGGILGKTIGLFYALYFTVYSIYIVVLQAQLVGVNIVVRTPHWIIIGLLIVTAIYVGSKGLVVMSWIADLVAPISLIFIILLILLGLKNVDFTILLPIFADSSFAEINLGALMFAVMGNDVFIVVKCSSYLENNKDIYKTYVYGILIFTILSLITTVVSIGALGLEQARHTIYPFLIYTRNINYRGAFERIDLLFVVAWLSANTGRIIYFMYFAYKSFVEALNLNKGKVLHYVLGIFIGLVSIYIAQTRVLTIGDQIVNYLQIYITATFVSIIPLIALIIYFFRRKTLNKDRNVKSN